jgi:hypothetical protein
MKKKVYVLMISRVFPATHPRRGEDTYFREKILAGQGFGPTDFQGDTWPAKETDEKKITTLRENYDHWARRAEKINRGEAVLSLRQWTGSPYNYKRDGSKPIEFLRLEKIQVQRVAVGHFPIEYKGHGTNFIAVSIDEKMVSIDEVAKNDGLTVDDFCKWFKKDMVGVIIHFTDFKY